MTRSGEENTVMHLSREDQEWLDGTLDQIVKKMEAVRERNAEKIPAVAVKGVYDDRADQSIEWDMDNGINWWTNGFWAGLCGSFIITPEISGIWKLPEYPKRRWTGAFPCIMAFTMT